MSNDPRRVVFEAVRLIRKGRPYTLAEVHVLDRALDEFLALSIPETVEVEVRSVAKAATFFNELRKQPLLGPRLSQEEVDGTLAICEACGNAGWPVSWVAYALATAYHETAGTMRPIKEYGRGRGRRYGVPGKHFGQVAYGRGYVQLTWDYNYERADKELKLDGALIRNYDLALDGDIAAAIMVRGMAEGWFTARKLSDYLPTANVMATKTAFKKARPIINGRDKDDLIADYAVLFQKALVAGGWE